MGRDRDEEVEKKHGGCFFLWTVIYFTITDVICYGCLVPLFGTYLAGSISHKFGWVPKWELVATVFLTFVMIYGLFCTVGESAYWKHLFALDHFYCDLLKVRDFINACMFLFCLYGLASTVEAMVNQDKGMKTEYVSEGASYVFLKTILQFFNLDHEAILDSFGYKTPRKTAIISTGENDKYERGAAYMLLWAMLSGCVAKLVYYNTLFTYLRAMEVFMSMRPYFDEDDDFDDSRSTLASRSGRTPSRLDNDFARSVRRTNLD